MQKIKNQYGHRVYWAEHWSERDLQRAERWRWQIKEALSIMGHTEATVIWISSLVIEAALYCLHVLPNITGNYRNNIRLCQEIFTLKSICPECVICRYAFAGDKTMLQYWSFLERFVSHNPGYWSWNSQNSKKVRVISQLKVTTNTLKLTSLLFWCVRQCLRANWNNFSRGICACGKVLQDFTVD